LEGTGGPKKKEDHDATARIVSARSADVSRKVRGISASENRMHKPKGEKKKSVRRCGRDRTKKNSKNTENMRHTLTTKRQGRI